VRPKVAYIQQQNGNWLNETCFAAAWGFGRMGYIIQPFELANAGGLDIQSDDVVHGGINGVTTALAGLGIAKPVALNPVKHLPSYLVREVNIMTLGELRVNCFDSTATLPMYIKPLRINKDFDAFCVTKEWDLNYLKSLDDSYEILGSEVVTFVSEYRCFVNRGKLVGAKHYTGDFRVSPYWSTVERAITDFKNPPVSYTLDFGITDLGSTQLIEINDGFGLGSYGLNPITYCKFIRDWWSDRTNLND